MILTLSRRVRAFLVEIPDSSHTSKLMATLIAVCLMSISAYVKVPLPFTPVPVTLQIFTLLLAAAVLGPFYGGLTQVIYVGLGLAGVPWFAGPMLGITMGYLAGFVAASGLVGYMAHHHEFRGESWRIGIAMAVGVVIIYIFGAFHFSMIMRTDYRTTIEMAVVPFILPDVGKIVCASLAAHWVFGKRWATPTIQKKRRGM